MSSGSSNMAGGALGTAFSFLLLASIIQGHQDVELFHDETVEAVVGQNISLHCIVKNITNLQIVNTEWSKRGNETEKLALYTPGFGVNQFRPDVNIQIVNNDANKLMGSYLQLHSLESWNSGIYICDVTTFPFGSTRVETELKIKDVFRVTCDVNSTVEVQSGENVTIQCTALRDVQYRWTKNEELVSQNESLQLWWVTDAHAGVYTLTASRGNETLHLEFIITIQATTTSSKRDLVTVSPQFNVSESLNKSADSGLTTSQSAEISTTWTMGAGTGVTDNNPEPSNVTITANVTSSSATQTDPYNFYNSTTRNDIRTEESSTAGNSTANSTSSGATSTLSAGKTTDAIGDNDTARSHLVCVFIIVPVLVLIAVAGIHWRRQIIKQRMDEPPSFKPPPPPVKYTAAKQRDNYPISRCNSGTEHEMKHQLNDV
ncbi:T-cell surface protein tactile [Thunnus thynnus]|uniref:T-cell surface protein tactile n=1 Tax=Thunnus thynnus TaxID=8237 RepID=UPI003528ECF8